MRPSFKITVEGDKLKVKAPERTAKFTNQVGLAEDGGIVSVGETAKIAASKSKEIPTREPAVRFAPILDLRDFDPARALVALNQLVIETGARSPLGLRPSIDFALEFPGYETLPAPQRSEFEIDVQYNLRVVDFTINGQAVGYPLSVQQLAQNTHQAIAVVWYVLGVAAILNTLPLIAAVTDRTLQIVLYGVNIAVIAVLWDLGMMLTYLGWVRLMVRRAPANLVRLILTTRESRLWLFKRQCLAIADRILDAAAADPGNTR